MTSSLLWRTRQVWESMNVGDTPEILVGEHKGELGVIVEDLKNGLFNILTLAGHKHLFRRKELKEKFALDQLRRELSPEDRS